VSLPILFITKFIVFAGLVTITAGFHPASAVAGSMPDEVDGFIIEQSQTRTGHEFYSHFMMHWEAPPEFSSYTIIITERANPQWGSIVWITVNDMIAYRGMLKPRYEEIRAAARVGVENVLAFLRQQYNLKNAGGPEPE
jgi:curli production assembly/transport component CsgE